MSAITQPTSSTSESRRTREASYSANVPKKTLFGGLDKRRRHGVCSWIRIDTHGNSQVLEIDRLTVMKRCDLPYRDLLRLDPLFEYPSTILGREKAIVVNLELIRCIITADEVLLLNALDSFVLQYAPELGKRLNKASQNRSISEQALFSGSSADGLLFEFKALDVALEAACSYLHTQRIVDMFVLRHKKLQKWLANNNQLKGLCKWW